MVGAIRLNVGGTMFESTVATLRAEVPCVEGVDQGQGEEHYLSSLAGGGAVGAGKGSGAFIDRDPTQFRHVLNYLRAGGDTDRFALPSSPESLRELRQEALFYGLPHLASLCEEEGTELCLRGTSFCVSPRLLRARLPQDNEDNLLALLPVGRKVVLDRDPTCFQAVLNYLAGGGARGLFSLPSDPDTLRTLRTEATCYRLPQLAHLCGEPALLTPFLWKALVRCVFGESVKLGRPLSLYSSCRDGWSSASLAGRLTVHAGAAVSNMVVVVRGSAGEVTGFACPCPPQPAGLLTAEHCRAHGDCHYFVLSEDSVSKMTLRSFDPRIVGDQELHLTCQQGQADPQPQHSFAIDLARPGECRLTGKVRALLGNKAGLEATAFELCVF